MANRRHRAVTSVATAVIVTTMWISPVIAGLRYCSPDRVTCFGVPCPPCPPPTLQLRTDPKINKDYLDRLDKFKSDLDASRDKGEISPQDYSKGIDKYTDSLKSYARGSSAE